MRELSGQDYCKLIYQAQHLAEKASACYWLMDIDDQRVKFLDVDVRNSCETIKRIIEGVEE